MRGNKRVIGVIESIDEQCRGKGTQYERGQSPRPSPAERRTNRQTKHDHRHTQRERATAHPVKLLEFATRLGFRFGFFVVETPVVAAGR